jgi:hypothetical protein
MKGFVVAALAASAAAAPWAGYDGYKPNPTAYVKPTLSVRPLH